MSFHQAIWGMPGNAFQNVPDFMGDDVTQHLGGQVAMVLQHAVIKDMDRGSRRTVRQGVGHGFRPKTGWRHGIHLNAEDVIGRIAAPPAWEPLDPHVCFGEHGGDHRLRASHDEVVDRAPDVGRRHEPDHFPRRMRRRRP